MAETGAAAGAAGATIMAGAAMVTATAFPPAILPGTIAAAPAAAHGGAQGTQVRSPDGTGNV